MLTERIASAGETPREQDIDCYSAAFFISGKIETELPLTFNEVSHHLDECRILTTPQIGTLVHLWNGQIGHIAVVTSLEPLLVVDRHGLKGEIRQNIPLTDVMFEYGGLDIRVDYLKPNITP